MNQLALVALLALLGVLLAAGCGESPPPAPSASPAPAPDQEEDDDEAPPTPEVAAPDDEDGAAEAAAPDDFVPPQNWCGTGHARPNWQSWEDARKELAERRAAIPGLIKRLQDEHNSAVRTAAAELGDLNAESAVPALVRLLETHEDPLVRFDATEALGKIGTPDVIAGLIKALGDKNCLVRIAAWSALPDVPIDFREAPPDGEGTKEKARSVRSRLLEAVQEGIQRKWRSWWRDNEAAFRQERARGK